jgi:ketosteroid isomerase-like protein
MNTPIPSTAPVPASVALTAEQTRHAALAKRFVLEILGGANWAAFDELVSPDVRVSTGLKPDGFIEGRDEYKAVFGSIFGSGAFQDAQLEVLLVLPTVDARVLVVFEAFATHVAPLWGVPATGRRVGMRETHLMTFRDGRLVENLVGACNPLDFEMIFASAISARILK